MKIAELDGSPHKNDWSNMQTGQFIKDAEESGHAVEILDMAHMDGYASLHRL